MSETEIIQWTPEMILLKLREIAQELNIGLDSVAFVDDNPVERQHVREQAPDAIVLDLPEDPMAYARAVRDCPAHGHIPPVRAGPRGRGQRNARSLFSTVAEARPASAAYLPWAIGLANVGALC